MTNPAQKLSVYLHPDQELRDADVINAWVNCILKCGNKRDSDVLLEQFLNHPFDFYHTYLFEIFKKYGDQITAEKLYRLLIKEDRLIEGANPEVLEVLGFLKYEPVKKVLLNYAFAKTESDYYLQTYAILGLLNFDCRAYEEIIDSEITRCYQKNLFPEFIPALVCKLQNRTAHLEALYELGDQYASTDCNAGILLGFSLCGEVGRNHFKKALFNPNWEAYAAGTGTNRFAYDGIKRVNVSFRELFSDIKQSENNDDLKYSLSVLFSLLEKRVQDYDDENMEDFASLYCILYSGNENLIDLADRVNKTEEAYRYQQLLEIKMTEEMIISIKLV